MATNRGSKCCREDSGEDQDLEAHVEICVVSDEGGQVDDFKATERGHLYTFLVRKKWIAQSRRNLGTFRWSTMNMSTILIVDRNVRQN
jgi:hypothetical protein